MCNVSFSHTVNSGRSHIASDFLVLVIVLSETVLVLVLVLAGCLTCGEADR